MNDKTPVLQPGQGSIIQESILQPQTKGTL